MLLLKSFDDVKSQEKTVIKVTMNNIQITNLKTKLCPGNPYTHHVQMIRTRQIPRNYLTFPCPQNGTFENSMLVFSNDLIARHVLSQLGDEYEIEETALYIPRYISETMRLPLVTVLNTYCETDTKEQVWSAHFYTPQTPATQIFRQQMTEIQ